MRASLDLNDVIILKKREHTDGKSVNETCDKEYAVTVKDFIDSVGKILSDRGWISGPAYD